MKPIFVTGYPKSGTSWFARLTADLLNCPLGGSIPSQDDVEPAREGFDRTGNCIVRKGHYQIVGKFENKPHTITALMIESNHIFHIVRDPRDIAVSASFYHKKPLSQIVDQMIKGERYGLPRWDDYASKWANFAPTVRYEDLRYNTIETLKKTFLWSSYDVSRLEEVVHRQSFDVRVRDDTTRLLRKGIVGDWKNYKETWILKNHFGDGMEMFGYE